MASTSNGYSALTYKLMNTLMDALMKEYLMQ